MDGFESLKFMTGLKFKLVQSWCTNDIQAATNFMNDSGKLTKVISDLTIASGVTLTITLHATQIVKNLTRTILIADNVTLDVSLAGGPQSFTVFHVLMTELILLIMKEAQYVQLNVGMELFRLPMKKTNGNATMEIIEAINWSLMLPGLREMLGGQHLLKDFEDIMTDAQEVVSSNQVLHVFQEPQDWKPHALKYVETGEDIDLQLETTPVMMGIPITETDAVLHVL